MIVYTFVVLRKHGEDDPIGISIDIYYTLGKAEQALRKVANETLKAYEEKYGINNVPCAINGDDFSISSTDGEVWDKGEIIFKEVE